ncbi:Ribosomal protein S5, bacterial-type [Candidatus Omnitrophus magneticus]|uniref:Small ribosomal subunit protein uS5 n=1 Tax=Candidatus Omnitrophus magneticus TaxID=1609969 RepID=A0A0F0CSB9_9BACT|nr:Ribosomal protein S5, bacterial-type [Candidatus Omnitrophus magneticus]
MVCLGGLMKKNGQKMEENIPKDDSKQGDDISVEQAIENIVQQGEKKEESIERVVKIGRVSKVVKGGKNFSFHALVVAGNSKGKVGIGFGKSNDVVGAISKGTLDAKKNFKTVNMRGDTIPYEVIGKFKASKVILKPASPGTGVIAGGAVRALCDAAGIKNILSKCLGSRNPINVVKATMNCFEQLRLTRKA